MDEPDDVRADGGLEDVREWDSGSRIGGHVALEGLNRDEGANGGGGGHDGRESAAAAAAAVRVKASPPSGNGRKTLKL